MLNIYVEMKEFALQKAVFKTKILSRKLKSVNVW